MIHFNTSLLLDFRFKFSEVRWWNWMSTPTRNAGVLRCQTNWHINCWSVWFVLCIFRFYFLSISVYLGKMVNFACQTIPSHPFQRIHFTFIFLILMLRTLRFEQIDAESTVSHCGTECLCFFFFLVLVIASWWTQSADEKVTHTHIHTHAQSSITLSALRMQRHNRMQSSMFVIWSGIEIESACLFAVSMRCAHASHTTAYINGTQTHLVESTWDVRCAYVW